MPTPWEEIASTEHAEELLRRFGRFAESCIKELHVWSGHSVSEDLTMNFERGPDTHARVLVQRQAAPLSAIELGFVSVVRLNVVPPPDGHDQIIFDATLRRIDDAWLWLPESDWDRISVADDACTWVSARRLFWRDASDWLGKTLRYGSSDPSFSVR